jgi:hypothetical protein
MVASGDSVLCSPSSLLRLNSCPVNDTAWRAARHATFYHRGSKHRIHCRYGGKGLRQFPADAESPSPQADTEWNQKQTENKKSGKDQEEQDADVIPLGTLEPRL